VDYYGIGDDNRLLWVNRGTNAAPTSGQTAPYTLFNYDDNGRVCYRERRYDGGQLRAHTMQWDGDGRLRDVVEGMTPRLSADYSGGGLRVGKWDSSTGSHDYSWGPGGLLHDSSGSTTYTPGAGERANGVDCYSHGDRLGSARYFTDSTGNGVMAALRYDAYGQKSAGSTSTPISTLEYGASSGYQTEHYSAGDPGLGLQYVRQRYYDPSVGRFLSPDPIRLGGGLNRYIYMGGDPVNGSDPTGTCAVDSILDVAFTAYDIYEFVREPSLLNGGALVLDAVGLALPCVTGLGEGLRAAEELARLRRLAEEAEAARLAREAAERAAREEAERLAREEAERLAREANDLAPPPGGCFVAGTPVLTQEGDRPIEKIRVGDLVLSGDPATGMPSYQRVAKTFVRETDVIVTVEATDGRSVETTPNHPFWVEGRGFVEARKLARSDLLREPSGRLAAISKITARYGSFLVYNFEVTNAHTYFAGGWWVHNQCTLGQARRWLNDGATEVHLGSRQDAEQLLWERWGGYRNATGFAPGEAERMFGSGVGYYHWDEALDEAGRLAGHGPGNPHGQYPHLQVHPPGMDPIRLFFGEALW
jgi:RHS repeat-associated protein